MRKPGDGNRMDHVMGREDINEDCPVVKGTRLEMRLFVSMQCNGSMDEKYNKGTVYGTYKPTQYTLSCV